MASCLRLSRKSRRKRQDSGLTYVEKGVSKGNKSVKAGDAPTFAPYSKRHTVMDSQRSETQLYRLALSAFATEEEDVAFDVYKSEVEEAGWVLVPIPSHPNEKSAYAIVPKGEGGRKRAASLFAESILTKAMRGLSSE